MAKEKTTDPDQLDSAGKAKLRKLAEICYPAHHHLWDEFMECDWVKNNGAAVVAGEITLPPPGDLSHLCPSQWDQGKPNLEEIAAMERLEADVARRIEAAKKKLEQAV
jgi:hypothetical protein